MRVQRVLMPGSRSESWTLLGDDHVPVEPVERFLSYLSSIERSPNTVKAYAHDLKDWFTFLAGRNRAWQAATLEDVAGFVAWLRLPPAGRDGRVQVLPSAAHQCSASSVNRKLAALTSFCEFHARHGVALAGLLVTMAPPGRGRSSSATSFRPFLQHITKNTERRRRTIKLASAPPRPRVLTAAEAQRSWTRVITFATGCCSRCCSTPGCGSVRRSVCGTRTSISLDARSLWWPGSTTTGPGPRAAAAGSSRPEVS